MNVTYYGYETLGGQLTLIVAGLIFLMLMIPRHTLGFTILPVFITLGLYIGPLIEWANMRHPFSRVGEDETIVQFVVLHDGSAAPQAVIQFGDGLGIFLLSSLVLFIATTARFLLALTDMNY